MQKKSEFVRELFTPLAEALGLQKAEELEAKGGLLQSKDAYIEQAKKEIFDAIESGFTTQINTLILGGKLLHEQLSILSAVEAEPIKAELTNALNAANSMATGGDATIKITDNPQTVLGLSEKTIRWIYSAGYTFFEKKENEKALAIFRLLTVLNPLIFDFKLAEAATLKELGLQEEALYTFSLASLLNPNHLAPHYNSADIHLNENNLDKAREEIDILEKLMQEQNRQDLNQELASLKERLAVAN